jgi:acetyltransferase-like isoleucine patch superfamily enzyme
VDFTHRIAEFAAPVASHGQDRARGNAIAKREARSGRAAGFALRYAMSGTAFENVRFIQIQGRISNLQCADDVFIGSGVTIDLSAHLSLGLHSIVSPGCSLITHQDFGDFNGNAIARLYPQKHSPITIGDDVVIGCDTTVLAGAEIESFTVIGAKSLVRGHVPGNSLFTGTPARFVRKLKDGC